MPRHDYKKQPPRDTRPMYGGGVTPLRSTPLPPWPLLFKRPRSARKLRLEPKETCRKKNRLNIDRTWLIFRRSSRRGNPHCFFFVWVQCFPGTDRFHWDQEKPWKTMENFNCRKHWPKLWKTNPWFDFSTFSSWKRKIQKKMGSGCDISSFLLL